MFSSSQFDSNSAFSGGGFMTTQATQFNDSSPSPKTRETHGLVPVIVKQISEASHSGDEKSSFIINVVDFTIVTLVGMVFEKAVRNTDVGFILDDGTGRIKCQRWVNETFDANENEEVQIVTNFDEISFHFIDCIHNLQSKSKGRVEGIVPNLVSSDSCLNTQVKNIYNGYQPPLSNPSYAQYSMDGLKDCDKSVLDYLQQRSDMSDERGIHVDELSRGLKLPLDKIMFSLKTLGDDGLVYSTIDDFHYKQA